MSGIISGITTSAKNVMNDAITAQGFRDIIGTGINSVRSLVDPSAKSDNIWQPQTLCITGDFRRLMHRHVLDYSGLIIILKDYHILS
ncbi:hypothetical protein GCM10022217_25080 [Chryseobacterium ginsenosidimutans]